MAGLVPAIHVFLAGSKDVDGRNESGHDDESCSEGLKDEPDSRVLVTGIHAFLGLPQGVDARIREHDGACGWKRSRYRLDAAAEVTRGPLPLDVRG